MDSNQTYDTYYDPTQAYYDPTQAYYDPTQAYYDPTQAYYDPYTSQYYDEPETAEMERDTTEEDRLVALESNRLYLKKVRKQCVLEDFVDLGQKQLYLFEILIESLEVNSDSVLGLTSSGENTPVYVKAKVQFLNSPYLDISENNQKPDDHLTSNNYFETVGNAWHSSHAETYSAPSPSTQNQALDKLSGQEDLDVEDEELNYDFKWENSTGKSCLFSMSALEMIHNLDKYPVNIQVDRCVDPDSCEPIAYTSVRLPDEIAMSVLQSLKPGVVLPVTSVLRQTCDLRNVFGVKKGNMGVFIRLSVFGPVIITSFQSVGSDRHYSFHPTPIASNVDEKEQKQSYSDSLKPLVSEEENVLGLRIPKEVDLFQKPVIWKDHIQHCCCLGPSYSKTSNLRGAKFDAISLIKMPRSSVTSLCRNVKSTKEHNNLGVCDWHNLVSSEIKNNPQCFCKEDEANLKKEKDLLNKLRNANKPYQPMPRIIGLGLKLDPIDCDCDCPETKKALSSKLCSSCCNK